MKTLVLSMISIAATIAAMTACTSESDPINDITNPKDAKVEIKLNAGVGTITTKAPIDKTFSSDIKVLFLQPEDATTPTWTSGTQICATIAGAAGHAIQFQEESWGASKTLYYNADGNKKSYLAGCYLDDANTTDDLTDGKITFSITGSQDIMATDGKEGSRASAFEEFTFNHLLAQLEFIIQPKNEADKAAVQSIFGNVTKIELLGQDTKFDLTLGATPTLIANTSPDNNALELTGSKAIDTGTSFGQLMIYPTATFGQTATPIKLKVYTANGGSGYEVNATIGDGTVTMAKSKKYTITINFTTKDIDATGAVGEWSDGGNGSTEI